MPDGQATLMRGNRPAGISVRCDAGVTLLVILYQEQAGRVQPDAAAGDNSVRTVASLRPP
jgi:hypothetical protein